MEVEELNQDSQDGSKFQIKSTKSEQEISEANEKIEEGEEDDAESVDSFEQKRRQFNFNKPKSWELQPVKIANVWDFMPDIIAYKWVKVRESGPAVQKKEREKTKVYKCEQDDCGKIFSDQLSLRKHMLTHGERMFLCAYEGCGKKFLDNSKLKRHSLVHTGEKKYKCDTCGKLFSLDFNLRTHMRTHTGEKPYVCRFPGCPKRFTQSSNLSAHEKIHLSKELTTKNGKGEEEGEA